MYISISYSGVEEHISSVKEEIRYLRLLRQNLARLSSREEAAAAASQLRRCANLVNDVERSAEKRAQLLAELIDGMKAAQRKNRRTVERIAAELEQEIWITKY